MLDLLENNRTLIDVNGYFRNRKYVPNQKKSNTKLAAYTNGTKANDTNPSLTFAGKILAKIL